MRCVITSVCALLGGVQIAAQMLSTDADVASLLQSKRTSKVEHQQGIATDANVVALERSLVNKKSKEEARLNFMVKDMVCPMHKILWRNGLIDDRGLGFGNMTRDAFKEALAKLGDSGFVFDNVARGFDRDDGVGHIDSTKLAGDLRHEHGMSTGITNPRPNPRRFQSTLWPNANEEGKLGWNELLATNQTMFDIWEEALKQGKDFKGMAAAQWLIVWSPLLDGFGQPAEDGLIYLEKTEFRDLIVYGMLPSHFNVDNNTWPSPGPTVGRLFAALKAAATAPVMGA